MRSSSRKVLTGGLLALGIAVPVVLAVEAIHQPVCDRACLIEFTNSYLSNAIAGRARSLPVSPDVRATENGRPVQFGGGVWESVKSVSAGRVFADASSGEAGRFAVLTRQDGRQLALALRLKINRQRLQEVDTVISPEAAASVR